MFVLESNLAFSIIHKPAFKELLELLSPFPVNIPSTRFFMETMEELYVQMKTNLVNILRQQKYVCITCDVWSTSAISYFGFTVHYFSKTYERISYALAFRQLKKRQTHQVMGLEINKVQMEHELPNEKVTNIVTDGGTGMCTSFKVYGKRHDILVEEIRGESDENIESNENMESNENIELNDHEPSTENHHTSTQIFMQNDNGEVFFSNIISLVADSLEVEISPNDDDEGSELYESFENLTDEISNEPIDTNVLNESRFELPPQRRCVSHLLNLVASDFDSPKNSSGQARTAFVTAYSKLHTLWVYSHRSSMAKTICKEVLGCCLLVPVVTRWNSKYDAVAKSCEPAIKSKINYLIQRLSTELNGASHLQILSNSDWAVLRDYLLVMKPVATSLDKLQGEKTASQGVVVPTLVAMRHRIVILEGGNILSAFKRVMLDIIRKRFGRYFDVTEATRDIYLAATSIPQFKLNFIENVVDQRKVRDLLREECIKLSSDNHESGTETNRNQDASNEDDFFLTFSHSNNVRRNSFENDVDGEISRYLNDDRKEITILDEYPSIREIFFRYNTTLSSSAPVERLFSRSKLIYRPQRNRLSAENFERALMLNVNSKLVNYQSTN